MNRTLLNRTKRQLQHFSVFAVAILILLTSCSIKGSIKNLAGIPPNTEQGITKAFYSFSSMASELCVDQTLTDSKIFQGSSFNTNDFLPAILLTTLFLLLAYFTFRGDQPHPFYRTQKVTGTLPLFLLYRKLLVHHSI